MALLATGCSQPNNYVPRVGASGEDMFRNACFECHKPQENGRYFDLDAEMASVAAIADKISEGGFSMPAFPHIEGEELQRLSEYVLAHSKTPEGDND
ncbi:hypothetical protein Tel_06580 [Candidatus Tenderia electrophaga]|uniref:Cytochrome c domain-containing protein n=1 Tax=Candidatus Tenderia electrophaga TaxID=1748243 RepID=A0A0S2TCI3_9GAMM|nr:hypothetical protein Tel_06580 [Candidatus Tenderia electrophaga]